MPAYWLNEKSRTFLSRGYLPDGMSAEDRIREIGEAAQRYLREDGFADKFVDYMERGWISLASPVWSNFGTERGGLPVSCNGSWIADDVRGEGGILLKTAEIGAMTKLGAGTSAYVGALRPRGAAISTGGKSNGPVHFMELMQSTTSVISQASVRRGSCAVYLDIEHADAEEFLECREEGHVIQNLSIGLVIGDAWMEEMIGGDKKKRSLWLKIIKKRFETGYPYLVFRDHMNDFAPPAYRGRHKIYASNLCFTGDVKVAVADGRKPVAIEDLAKSGFEFPVFSASRVKKKRGDRAWSTGIQMARAVKTGTREVVEVTCSNGMVFRCTPDHKLGRASGGYVKAQDSEGVALEGRATLPDMKGGISQNFALAPAEDVVVESIKPVEGEVDVYDLNVDVDHNFFISNDDETKGVLVHNCTEIALPSSPDWSFVCCLSSLNLLHWDEWKSTDLIETMTKFLDAVMEEYVQKTDGDFLMESAHRFALENRAIGLGVLGWHSYLQNRGIPFESLEAKKINVEVFRVLDERSLRASRELASRFGEPVVCRGLGVRNATRLAVAPTTSSSFILGQVSPSVEPENSNYYTKDLQKGKFTHKNPYLKRLLREKKSDTRDVWDSILVAGGSVQHLDFLDEREKSVFKTFGEIDPTVIIDQAAHRQKFIDQAQSINLMIHPSTPVKTVNSLVIRGWESGLKSLYYQRGTNPSQEYVRSLISCTSCEA